MKSWVAVCAVFGLALGIAISFALDTAPANSSGSGRNAGQGETAASTTVNPLARAHLYPDPPDDINPKVVALCMGASQSVPGAPKPSQLPDDRHQTVALVTEGIPGAGHLDPGDEVHTLWGVVDLTKKYKIEWAPDSAVQLQVAVAHLGYVVCIDQKHITFKGKCVYENTLIKVDAHVTVREAHSGTVIGSFDAAPPAPDECGNVQSTDYYVRPTWADFGSKVTKMVRQ